MKNNLNCWLYSTPIAHRGFWNEQIVENSITSYKNAIEKGYPIEIDIYSSSDGVLYSFHDENLLKMTGAEGKIHQKSSLELDALMLKGTREHIPKLKDVLALVDGKIPLLIEIKNQPDKLIIDRILELLRDYKGEFALQSFNPVYIKQIKKKAPFITRGLLYTRSEKELKSQNVFVRFILKKMLLNPIIKPHFLAVRKEDLASVYKKRKKYPFIAWTVQSQSDYEKIKPLVDNIIFDGFTPKI